MSPERRRRDSSEPDTARAALEAANQALEAANAAVQAAVQALALSQARERQRPETTRRAPSRRPAARPPRAPRRTGAQDGRAAAPADERPVSDGAPPRSTLDGVPEAVPLHADEVPAEEVASPGATAPEATVPEATVVTEPPLEAQPRPKGSGPILLGPAPAPAATPQVEAPPVAEADAPSLDIPPPQVEEPPVTEAEAPPLDIPSAPVEPGPTPEQVLELARQAQAELEAEVERRKADLLAREAEVAEREAAMARYEPMGPALGVPARPPAEPNGYTVLVVDDEEQVRALTVRILTRFGFKVMEAPGVEQAMAALDNPEAAFDLVLSDVAMPGLSGKDLFQKISESRPGLPVVFMSGYALNVYAPEGLIEAGVKLLPKPFTQEDLLDFVHEALPGAVRS